ncbi:unnamed protein product, partial [Amoebophrya sp. A25]
LHGEEDVKGGGHGFDARETTFSNRSTTVPDSRSTALWSEMSGPRDTTIISDSCTTRAGGGRSVVWGRTTTSAAMLPSTRMSDHLHIIENLEADEHDTSPTSPVQKQMSCEDKNRTTTKIVEESCASPEQEDNNSDLTTSSDSDHDEWWRRVRKTEK